jgi:hypothetical protein
MKGTEKQVAWAEEIKARTVKAINDTIAHLETMDAPADKKAAAIAEQMRRLDVVTHIQLASDMIDDFQSVRGEDLRHDVSVISAAFKFREKFWLIGK